MIECCLCDVVSFPVVDNASSSWRVCCYLEKPGRRFGSPPWTDWRPQSNLSWHLGEDRAGECLRSDSMLEEIRANVVQVQSSLTRPAWSKSCMTSLLRLAKCCRGEESPDRVASVLLAEKNMPTALAKSYEGGKLAVHH